MSLGTARGRVREHPPRRSASGWLVGPSATAPTGLHAWARAGEIADVVGISDALRALHRRRPGLEIEDWVARIGELPGSRGHLPMTPTKREHT